MVSSRPLGSTRMHRFLFTIPNYDRGMEESEDGFYRLQSQSGASRSSARANRDQSTPEEIYAEEKHEEALAIAFAQHANIRESAIRAIEIDKAKKHQEKLAREAAQQKEYIRIAQENARREEELVRLAKEKAQHESRLRESQNERDIENVRLEQEKVQHESRLREVQRVREIENARLAEEKVQNESRLRVIQQTQVIEVENPTNTPVSKPAPAPISQSIPKTAPAPALAPAHAPAPAPVAKSNNSTSEAELYATIHRNLKALRAEIVRNGRENDKFRKITGEMRRSIRNSVGQLTPGQTNKQQLENILDILRKARDTQQPGVDPTVYMLPSTKPQQPSTDPRVPAVCNGDKLPILLVYLLNQLSKAIIAQLITETGAKPDTATPLGLLVAQVFSLPDFSFRGATLIDILMAKYRVVCPVLWGISGNDKTNEGRARLGWWKEEDEFVTEEVHNSRMTGLGAGWAAICLRNFSKSKNKSPWPVWHYWQSLSLITSTSSAQASNTHYIVLKAMLEGSEKAFVNFYGSMAIMAMQIAMLHFPARAIKQTAASLSLTVLADKLLRDENFDLANYSGKKQGI